MTDKIVLITDQDIGTGLKVEAQKLVVDRDALAIPVDVKLAGVSLDRVQKKLTFTLSDQTVIEQDVTEFLAVDTDTTLTSGELDVGNKRIKLVDSEAAEVHIDISAILDGINAKHDKSEEKVKLVSLADVTIGYAFKDLTA